MTNQGYQWERPGGMAGQHFNVLGKEEKGATSEESLPLLFRLVFYIPGNNRFIPAYFTGHPLSCHRSNNSGPPGAIFP